MSNFEPQAYFIKPPAVQFTEDPDLSSFYTKYLLSIKIKLYMESSILWDIPPYSPLKVSRSFGGTDRLYLQVEE
jgi:hypothetical protein